MLNSMISARDLTGEYMSSCRYLLMDNLNSASKVTISPLWKGLRMMLKFSISKLSTTVAPLSLEFANKKDTTSSVTIKFDIFFSFCCLLYKYSVIVCDSENQCAIGVCVKVYSFTSKYSDDPQRWK